MNYTKNSDPTYYESHRTNCGSFALSIKEWYCPDATFIETYGEVEEWAEEIRYETDINDYDLSNLFAYKLIDIILDDFEDLLFVDDIDVENLKPNEELIAFRAFYTDDFLWDFHFKVYRDGRWQEKCGNDSIQDCYEDDWDYGALVYLSDTFYFIRKVN